MSHALASRTHLGQRNRFGDAVVPGEPYAWARHLLIRAQRRRGERTP